MAVKGTRSTRSDQAALVRAVLDATDTAGILAALAAVEWRRAGRAGEPEVPTAGDLAGVLSDGTATAEAAERARGVLGAAVVEIWPAGHMQPEGAAGVRRWPVQWVVSSVVFSAYKRVEDGPGVPESALEDLGTWRGWKAANPEALRGKRAEQTMHGIESIHAAWRALPDDDRPKHPVAPLVRAWLDRPRPGMLAVRSRDSIPTLRKLTDGMPVFEGGGGVTLATEPVQMALFGAPGEDSVLSVWWLDLWRASGIGSRSARGAVPLAVRLRDQALLRFPANLWDSRPHVATNPDTGLPPTLGEVGRWLYDDPDSFRRRWGRSLRESLMLAARQVPVTFADGSRYMWRLLDLNLPVDWDPDLPVGIICNVPGGGVRGGMRVNGERLRALGMRSLEYRVYLLACYLLDRHARRGVRKTARLRDGKPNPFIERPAQGRAIPARRAAEYVRVVPWDAMLRAVFEEPTKDSKRRVLEALERLRDGAGMPDGPDGRKLTDPFGIDFREHPGGVQVFGSAPWPGD